MKLLVTGGSGFIGSAVVRQALAQGHRVINLDALTYAASWETLADVAEHPGYIFEHCSICDPRGLARAFLRHRPDKVMHLAAESHVDRSISGPAAFLDTNITGTFHLLEAARNYWMGQGAPEDFRFHHVSTDEVFGSLGPTGQFDETSPYAPNSPYSASKAASDHLVRAWGQTYDLPVLISHCSNNYGPYQFPEKLIPVAILAALAGRDIPVYGQGQNIRDWLFVEDHAAALLCILSRGQVGRSYAIGGGCEKRNIDLVQMVCAILDRSCPKSKPYGDQITFVADRKGHDARYAIDSHQMQAELGWQAQTPLDVGLTQTVGWYLAHPNWWKPLQNRQAA